MSELRVREAGAQRSPRSAGAWTVVLLCAGVILTLSSCLMSEFEEEDITLGDNGRGSYAITLHNLQSDGETPHHQDEDFRTVLRVLTSDDYLLDRASDGIYVKQRTLTLVKGTLVGRESGLFGNPSKIGLMLYPDSTYRRRISRGLQVIQTNGNVIQSADSVSIRWPKRARQFSVKLKDKSFEPNPGLAQRYKKWKARKP